MRLDRSLSVRDNLASAILLTMVLSWLLGAGIANYLNYLSMKSLHQDMLARPDVFPTPIPEPHFGILQFLTGRYPMGPPPRIQYNYNQTAQIPQPQHERSYWDSPAWFDLRWLLLQLAAGLGLSTIAGIWLGKRFTRPLLQLAKGADAFQSGDFKFRVSTGEQNEFADVADAMNVMAKQVSDHIGHLEDDAERRRQFLADIAHELRSPVTTMRTMVGALQDGIADEPARRDRALKAIERTSERLERLVEELMELAKLDLNELPMSPRVFDLRELIMSCVNLNENNAAKAGIVLKQLSPGPQVNINADPDRITQIIVNILENAINYAGECAEISLDLADTDPVIITIKDTGKGISESNLPYIFDTFYRADEARTPGDSHSGLGLSITKRLVQAHNGSIDIESESGKGTKVIIKIPRNIKR